MKSSQRNTSAVRSDLDNGAHAASSASGCAATRSLGSALLAVALIAASMVLTPSSASAQTAPTAEDDVTSVAPGASVVIQVLVNDGAAQPLEPLTIVALPTAPATGVATITDRGTTVTFDAPPDFTGTSFTYEIENSSGQMDTASVTVDAVCGDVRVTAAGAGPALDAAIIATNACRGPQTITVEPGRYNKRTTFETITDDLAIIGDPTTRPVIIIDVVNTYATTFRVAAGATVTFENLVFDDPGGFSCFVCMESATVLIRNVQMNGSFPSRSEGNVAAIWAQASQLTIENSEINNADGSAVAAFDGSHVIAVDTTITGSSGNGIGAETLEGTRLRISGGGTGVNVSGEVTLIDSHLWNNTFYGFRQTVRTTSTIANTVIGRDPDGNAGSNGIGVSAFGEMLMSNSVVANSVDDGIAVYPQFQARAEFTDVQVLDNGGLGLSISGATTADLTRVTISGNGAEGLYLIDRPATVVQSTISSNGTDCYFFRAALVDGGSNTDSDGTCGFVIPNATPVAVADQASTGPTQTIAIDVLANDTDADADELTVVSVTSPNAAVVSNGLRISYTAPSSFTGESFSYTITDPLGATATAEVVVELSCGDITVTPADGGEGLHAAVELTEICSGPQTVFMEPGTYILDTGFDISDELTMSGTDPTNPARFEFRAAPLTTEYVFFIDDPAGPFAARNLVVDATAPWALGFFRSTDATVQRVGFQSLGGSALGCSFSVRPSLRIFDGQLTFDSSQLLLPSCDGISVDPTASAVVTSSLIAGSQGHGIDNRGALTMTDTQLAENLFTGVTAAGAGSETRIDGSFIWGNGSHGIETTTYTLVTDSAIGLRPEAGDLVTAGNVGNGISSSGPLDVDNVYVAHNDDGIARFGASPGTITDATIYDNRSNGFRGGETSATTMTGTSLSNNGPNCLIDATASLIDGGGNIDDDGTCGINQSPVAVDNEYLIDEDTSLDIAADGVLGDDTDGDGDALTAELVQGPSHAATFELEPSGAFTYVPEADYAGEDSFTYSASDGTFGDEATVTVTIDPINDAPTLELAATATAALGETTTLSVRVDDVDADDSELHGFDPITPAVQLQVEHGTLTATPFGAVVVPVAASTIAVAGEIEAINKTLATLTYTPDDGYLGADTLTVTIDDRGENGLGGGLQVTGSMAITVVEQNDPPVPANESYETDEDTTLTVAAPGVLNNDLEPEGDAMTAILVTDTSSGTVNLDGDGSFVYEPLPDFFGTDSFTYNVSDGVNRSIDATVTIAVAPVDDDMQAAAAPDALTFDEDTAGQISVTLTDVDSQVDDGVVTATVVDGSLATAAVAGSGGTHTVTVTGEPDASGTTLVQIGYGHNSTSALLIVPVMITPVNDPPAILPIPDQTTDEDTPFAFQIAISDAETDVDDLMLTIETDPAGLATITRTLQSPGLNVVPVANAFGTTTVTVRVSDGEAEASTTFELVILPVNDSPVGVSDSYTTTEDTPLKVNEPTDGVLANDTDIDDASLTAVRFTDASHGSVVGESDGTFSYEPDAGFAGEDAFTYVVSDGTAQSEPVTVTVTVEAVDDPPTAEPDTYSTDEDVELLVPPPGVLANDVDPDTPAAELRAVLDELPATGQLTLAPGGGFTYIPELNLFGPATFSYYVADATSASAPVTVTIDVRPVNDPPVLQAPDRVETLEATTVSFDVIISDVETPVASLELSAVVDDPTSGAVSVGQPAADGTTQVTFTPTAGPGLAVVTLSLRDSTTGTPVTAMVAVGVLSTNRSPTAILETPASVIEGSGDVAIDATSSTDPDGDLLSYSFAALAGLVDNGDGTATFTDTADDGVFQIAIEVCDPAAACDTEQAVLTVENAPPALDLDTPASGLAGVELALDVAFTDPGVLDIHDVVIDWGDGTVDTAIDAASTTNVVHTFVTAGSYVVVVTVIDDDGGQDVASSTIEVADAGLQINTTDDGSDTNPGDGVCFIGEFLDDGRAACSLRAAIQETNALPGAQTLDVPAGTYSALSSILITDDLALIGLGPTETTIDAVLRWNDVTGELTLHSHTLVAPQLVGERVDLVDMVVQVVSATSNVWTMSDSLMVDGTLTVVQNLDIIDSTVDSGARITSRGTLGFDNVEFVDSHLYHYGLEAAIVDSTFDSAQLASTGALGVDGSEFTDSDLNVGGDAGATITRSHLVGGEVRFGGMGSGPLLIADSELEDGRIDVSDGRVATISSTIASTVLLRLAGQVTIDSTLLIESVIEADNGFTTVVNTTASGGAIIARDQHEPGGSVLSIESSTIAATLSPRTPAVVTVSNSYIETCDIPVDTTIMAVDSADGDGTCVAGVLAGIDPLLGPLQNNGGPTFTFALLEDSPLLDAVGDGTTCPATDQRGEPRPFDADDDGAARCDIGAFEAQEILAAPNQPPTAALPAAIVVDEGSGDVVIDATSSTDPDDDLLTYRFAAQAGLVDNGDGTAIFSDTADDGVFEISVEVCDHDDACDVATVELTVQNVAPELMVELPANGVAGLEIELSAVFSDIGVEDTHQLTIDWGDGTTETLENANETSTQPHTFIAGGAYVVVVTVIDDDGGQGSDSSTFLIADAELRINTTEDGSDTDPGDGLCFIGWFLDDGRAACSLRAAIEETNVLPGEQTLDIPAGTYTEGADFDWLDDPLVVLDDLTMVGAGRTATVIEVVLRVRHRQGRLTLHSHTQMLTYLNSGHVALVDMDMHLVATEVDTLEMRESELHGVGAVDVDVAFLAKDSTIERQTVRVYGAMELDNVEVTNAWVFPEGPTLIMSSTFDLAKLTSGRPMTVDLSEIRNSELRLSTDFSLDGTPTISFRRTLLQNNEISLLTQGGAVSISESEVSGGELKTGRNRLYLTETEVASANISVGTLAYGERPGELFVNASLLRDSTLSSTDGLVSIVNSTIDGGAIRVEEVDEEASLSIDSSTLVVGLQVEGSASVEIVNSYVEQCDIASEALHVDVNSADGDGSCVNGPLTGIDPLLGPLQNNGGPTDTFALLEDSPLLDAVPAAAPCQGVDQRGETRPFDADDDGTAACDVGSVEAQTILADPPGMIVFVSPPPVVITEDGPGAGLVFDIVQLSAPVVPFEVRWRPVSGSPHASVACPFFGLNAGVDISGGFGPRIASVEAGQIVVVVNGCPDNELEPDKVIDVVLVGLDGTELASTQVTVLDDDEPPQLRLLDVTIEEGDPTGPLGLGFNRLGTLSLEVVRPPERDYSVTLQPLTGSGSVSFGLTCVPAPLVGAPDAIAGPFRTVSISADTVPGTILTFEHTLACRNQNPDPARSYQIEVVDGPLESGGVDDKATVTIVDDDGGVASSDSRVSISNATVTEGNSGDKVVTVTVTVAADAIPLGLTWSTFSQGPAVVTEAIAGVDYLAAGGSLSFGAQGGTEMIELTVFGDELVEGDEWFRVLLRDDTGSVLTAQASVRIRDDEYISIRVLDAAEVVEGDVGSRTMTFTVTASAEPPSNATYYLGTHDAVDASLVPDDPGRATGGSDFTSKYAGVTFGPGLPLSQTFTVSVRGDETIESAEAIYVIVAALGGPGYPSTTVERGAAVGIIRDDDQPPTVSGPGVLQVVMSDIATTVPVVYPVTALDSESNVLPVVCSPGSGSLFGVGTHTAKCTATDSYGNSASLIISIEVTRGRGNGVRGPSGAVTSQAVQGATLEVTAQGFAPLSFVRMELRSDPLELGEAQADADGGVSARVTIPVDAPLGFHTIAILGQAADGTPRHVLLPVEVVPRRVMTGTIDETSTVTGTADASGGAVTATASESAADAGPPEPQVAAPLAHTGARSNVVVQIALMLMGVGCVLVAMSRRRRYA